MSRIYNYLFDSQTNVLWFTYWMHILVLPALVGFLINSFKSKQFQPIYLREQNCTTDCSTRDTVGLLASHHQWLIRNFNLFVVLAMISVGTIYVGVGYVVAVVAVVWWFISLARGMYSLTMRKPMPHLYYPSMN